MAPLLLDGPEAEVITALARAILRRMGASSAEALCVATEDRLEVMAAVLATWMGGLHLVLPHGLERSQVEAACREHRCGALLGEAPVDLPETVRLGAEGRVGPELTPSADRSLHGATLAQVHLSSAGAGQGSVTLHTGGSTGRPRAWRRSLPSLLGEADALISRLGLRGTDRLMATVSPLHIYGLMLSVLVPLRLGAGVVRRSGYFPREVEGATRRWGCTVLVATPPHLRILGRGAEELTGLRLITSSGSMLFGSDAEAVYARTRAPVVEVYGSTETGAVATRCRARGQSRWAPLQEVDARVHGGRLQVRSPFLSEGLARREDGFVDTGDRASWPGGQEVFGPGGAHPAGDHPADVAADAAAPPGDDKGFVLLGRADGVIKIAGVRVDMLGVEEVIRSLPGVRDACVVSVAVEGLRENALLAAVVADSGQEELRRALDASLSPAERPRRILWLDQMPVSPPGKHDRRAVLALFGDPDTGEHDG